MGQRLTRRCAVLGGGGIGKFLPSLLCCRRLMETNMRSLTTQELIDVTGGCASECNNGLGNGDQGAPGGSYPNNQAENNTVTGVSPSGKDVVPDNCGKA